MELSPRCVLRRSQAFKELRRRFAGKQADCALAAGISGPTMSRLERGLPVEKTTAELVFGYLTRIAYKDSQNFGAFNAWFDELSADVYEWDQVIRGADIVGKKIFHRFRADAVLTFPGASAIFTNLVMARSLSPEEFLRKPVHMAWFENKRLPAKAFSSFTRAERGTWSILVPKALDGSNRQMRTVAIVDDHIISGVTLDSLKRHLIENHNYTSDRIIGACCVLGPNPIIPWNPRDVRAFVAEKADFLLPWGHLSHPLRLKYEVLERESKSHRVPLMCYESHHADMRQTGGGPRVNGIAAGERLATPFPLAHIAKFIPAETAIF